MDQSVVSLVVFVASLLATFFVAAVGRRTAKRRREDDLAGRSLNRWLVGLSAGATANSGFVVTGAVGLGYSFGMQWIMMPVAWFLGDLVFWYWFPERINAFGHKTGAVTLSEILRHGLEGPWATAVSLMATTVIVAGLAGYTAAQWLAGQKFLAGAFGLHAHTALAMFALLIISYSSIGGFRGSVYADAFQAAIRLAATTLVLGASIWIAVGEGGAFQARIDAAGNDFFNPFPGATLATGIGFVVGWAAAAMGFGLGQPHIVSRYLASSSPSETRAARWIYLGFVQFTWLSMTVFGMILRGIMPDLDDPEAGLSVFVQTFLFAAVSGVIVADVFGVIASTANSLLISMAQSLRHDVLDRLLPQAKTKLSLGIITLLAGLSTMVLSAVMGGSVVSLALSSVSMVGAGLAVPVMIKVSGWKHTGASLTGSMVVGIASAAIWVQVGFPRYLNEAAIGMLFSFGANWLLLMVLPAFTTSPDANQTAARDQFEDA
jgi:sodium/proline symporter